MRGSLHVSLDGEGALYRRLYRGLRRAIVEGRLPVGARLPSTRSLAADFQLSRNVVIMAFEQLLAEGYVEGRTGSGTFVSTPLPDGAVPAASMSVPPPAATPPRLSAQARRVLAMKPLRVPGAWIDGGLRYDFRYGLPSFEDFPHETWRRLIARRARAASLRTLRYGPAAGYGPLREAIAAYLRRARGLVLTADQVVVVAGTQQALDLTARLLVDRGDCVVVEEPGYQAVRQVFGAAGARLVPRRVDEAGLDVEGLPRSVRLLYVTPSHQFPTGAVMPPDRRLALVAWAESTGAYVLEDDYDSEFRYEGRPVAAVQGLDRAGHVLYTGTFSKVLFPSLRIGYLVAPRPLVPALVSLKFLTDCHAPTFEQEVLADFIGEGHFERHLRRSRARNGARRAVLLEALAGAFGDGVAITGANAGIHVVAWFRGLDASVVPSIVARALARGVGVYPVAPYYVRPPREAGLLLGYASLSEREIRAAVRILAEVVRLRR